MNDPTEGVRREMVKRINSAPEDRVILEGVWGKGNVWNTEELTRDFTVHAFAAPLCVVTRKSDHKRGTLMFQHHPRFYYGFEEDR